MKFYLSRALGFALALSCFYSGISQPLDVTSCPTIVKRSNGNGQASNAAGDFRPQSSQNNPVAPNVTGTSYQLVPYDPSVKTGDIHFVWTGTSITNLPIIARVWIAATGSTTGVLSNIKFGPPTVASQSGNDYHVTYAFYNNNLPNAGKMTLEFTDPQTGLPVFQCTYDLQGNGAATPPAIDCSPTIITQPQTQTLCGATSASFSVVATGATAFQWQVSTNGTTFTNLVNGGDYSGATSATLTINNPNSYNGYFYRVVLSSTGCGTTTSNFAQLIANTKPTAVFSGATSMCGTGNRSLGIVLTGTAPWSVTYSTTPLSGGSSSTTINNIISSPYYIAVSPSASTAYTITNVSDLKCTNSAPTGTVAVTVYSNPVITPANASVCLGNSSFSLPYSITGTPNKFSITTGIRALPGFSPINNATLVASPLTIPIPTTGISAGTYDFNLVVTNSTTNCVSAVVPFTLTINALPVLSANSVTNNVCPASSVSLLAAPANLTSYSWSANPAATVASVYNPTVTPNATTTYTVTGTNSNGCSSTASTTVTVLPAAALSVTPSASTICSQTTTQLSVSGGNTYSWSPSTGLSATTGASVLASPATTTTYTVTSANETGCSAIGTVTVTVSDPSVGVNASSSSICSGGSSVLTASGASTYSWYPSTGLSATTGSSVTATPAVTTTYYVTGTTAAGCSKTVSTTISILAAPINTATSVSNYYTFCTSGVTSFTLPVNLTAAATSMTWGYATTAAGPYTTFTSAVSPTGATFTPSSSGSTNSTLTVSNYSNGGYKGPKFLQLTIVTSTCSYNYNIELFDTKGSGTAVPSPIVAKSTICSGETASLTVGSLNAGLSVTWQSSTSLAGTYTTIPNETSSTYTTPVLTSSMYYKAAYSGGGGCSYTSDAATITVAAAISSNVVSPATSCTNGSTYITLTGNAITGGVFQWQKSTISSSSGFTDIAGANGQNYTLTTTLVPTTTWFRRIASTSTCSTIASAAAAVYPPVTNNQITNGVTTFCGTTTATTLTTSTPVGGDGTYTYSWESSTNNVSFTVIGGAGSATYNAPAGLTQTLYYRRIVTSGGCATSTSNSFVITVNPLPTVMVTAGTFSICSGNSTILTGSGASTYSWSPSTGLSATSGPTVTASPVTTQLYTVTGTSTAGCINTANTTITVTTSPASPTVSSANKTICNTVASFDLSSMITSGAGTYEWYTAPVANAGYLVPTPLAVTGAGTYYVFRKNGSCYSNTSASITLSIANVSAPSVAATGINVCAPATVDLASLQPTPNIGTTLEWHTGNTSGSSLVAAPAAAGAGTFYLFAYSAAGACYGASSEAVTVTVNSLPVSTVAASPAGVCEPATFNLDNYNTTGNGTYTYQWHTVSSSPTPATLVYTPTSVATSGNYFLYATSASGCSGTASAALLATINQKPIVGITAPGTVCGGTPMSIVSTTLASSPTYSWEVSSDGGLTFGPVSNGGVYSGAATGTLGISNSTGLGGKLYRVTVTENATGCTATSSSVVISEETAPVISRQPVNTLVNSGSSTAIFLDISGSPTANFQWYVSTNGGSTYSQVTDNAVYSGSNTTDLLITNATVSMTGYYYKCIVSNNCVASLASAEVILTVNNCAIPSDGGSVTGSSAVCTGTNNSILSLTGNTGSVVKWQSSVDNFISDVTDISNTAPTYTATNLTATTSFRAIVQNGGCAFANSSIAKITVLALPVVTSAPPASQVIATGNTADLVITASNTTGYQWKKNNVNILSATSSTLSFAPLTLNDNGIYTIVISNSGCSVTSSSYEIIPSVILYSKASGNLNIAANWGVNSDGTGSTPVDFTRDEHTFVVANRSSANTGGNLTIAGTLDLKDAITNIGSGSTLTAGVIKRSGTTGTLAGSSTSNLTITGIGGTTTSNLWFAAGSQVLKNLTITNVNVTLNTPLAITAGSAAGTVSITSGGVLAAGDFLTLMSDLNGTARVAPGSASGGYITGNVTVERYIPQNPNRAWRLLSVPTTGQSFHEAWQENQAADVDPGTGYGTILTSNSTNWAANGYDEKTPGNSLLAYNAVTDALYGVPNTNASMATNSGYYVYIRGDRSVKQSASTTSINATTLRTKGALYQGTQPAINIPADKSALVGNIYPSTIDVRNITLGGGSVNTSFDLWDPKLIGSYGLGGFQTLTLNGGNYIITPGGGSYGTSGSAQNTIQSGQAFFVTATGADGSLTLTESAKTTGSNSMVFSPPGAGSTKRLITNLYAVTDTAANLADGTLQLFDDYYENAVDAYDAKKRYNFGENLYIVKQNNDLIVEKRSLLAASDTIFFGIENLKKLSYKFEFTATGLDDNNLAAWLEDSYTKTATNLSLNGTTTVKFAIDANNASKAINRFRIVFKQQVILPVTFVSVKAFAAKKDITIGWQVVNQVNVKSFEIERSVNGTDFIKAGTRAADGTNGATVSYDWLDNNANAGDNYYRVVSIDNNGNRYYSQVAKVVLNEANQGIAIYPNPVTNGTINLRFSGMAAGSYTARLLAANGSLIQSNKWLFTGNNGIHPIAINNHIINGSYLLEIIHPDKTKTLQTVIVNR